MSPTPTPPPSTRPPGPGSAPASGRGPRFRLRGEVGGAQRTFLLTTGVHLVGSHPGCDLVLPGRGVSRHHAELTVGDSGVAVRDLGSKNGIRIAGRRCAGGGLGPGDRLAVGGVKLVLEEVDEGDRRLAIELPAGGGAPAAEARAVSEATPFVGSLAWGAGLALLDEALAHLAAPRPDLGAALATLAGGLGARGACLSRCAGGGEPLVIASWGRLDATGGGPAGDPTARPPTPEPPSPGEIRPLTGSGLADGFAGARLGSRDGDLVLAFWGLSPSGTAAVRPLLRTALRLLDVFAPDLPGGPAPPAAKGAGAAPGSPDGVGDKPELRFPPGYVTGTSPAMTALHRQIRAIAGTGLPVLLRGETGVGKEMVARTVHLSSRRAGPLVTVNCAAIPAELLEAEMFGIGKGVASGVDRRRGRFREADGGTLFLDEVGEMPPPLQAKLLRALESGEVHPVGRRPVAVDVRLVAATNADLEAQVAAGDLRSDLYYRLAGCVLEVPPLRARREDVPPLVERFVARAAEAAGKKVRGVTWSALERLAAHPWPGNVRQLRHEVERLVHLCGEAGVIDSTLLPAALVAATGADLDDELAAADSLRLADHVGPLERRLAEEALRRTGGNRTRAAELLGLSRNGLAYKLKTLGLDD